MYIYIWYNFHHMYIHTYTVQLEIGMCRTVVLHDFNVCKMSPPISSNILPCPPISSHIFPYPSTCPPVLFLIPSCTQGPVLRIKWCPFLPYLFITCSADWSIKLWHQDKTTPMMSFTSAQCNVSLYECVCVCAYVRTYV